MIFAPGLGTLSLLLGHLVQPPGDNFCFIILCFIVLFGCNLLKACSFVMRARKGVGPEAREGVGELGAVKGRENIIRIYYII